MAEDDPDPTVGQVDPLGPMTDPESEAPEDETSTIEPLDILRADLLTLVQQLAALLGPLLDTSFAWSTDPDAASASASSSSARSVQSGSGTIPSAGWAACGLNDSRYKIVKDYMRLKPAATSMSGTTARLYCGIEQNDKDDSAFGYRHVSLHRDDWQNKANYINRNWRDLAGWAMSYTLKSPDRVTRQTNRFCYQRKFYLADNRGNTVATMVALVALGETGVRVMTAYPTTKGNCSGTKIYG